VNGGWLIGWCWGLVKIRRELLRGWGFGHRQDCHGIGGSFFKHTCRVSRSFGGGRCGFLSNRSRFSGSSHCGGCSCLINRNRFLRYRCEFSESFGGGRCSFLGTRSGFSGSFGSGRCRFLGNECGFNERFGYCRRGFLGELWRFFRYGYGLFCREGVAVNRKNVLY
jgi:hypothetical protein